MIIQLQSNCTVFCIPNAGSSYSQHECGVREQWNSVPQTKNKYQIDAYKFSLILTTLTRSGFSNGSCRGLCEERSHRQYFQLFVRKFTIYRALSPQSLNGLKDFKQVKMKFKKCVTKLLLSFDIAMILGLALQQNQDDDLCINKLKWYNADIYFVNFDSFRDESLMSRETHSSNFELHQQIEK